MNFRFKNLKFKSGEKPGSIDFSDQKFEGNRSKADQSFKDASDINTILAGYKRAGVDPFVVTGSGGDFSTLPSFHDAQNIIVRATDQFMSLDSKLRKRFDNDPAEFLAFVHDPSNDAEMYTLGLKVKPVVADPQASAEVIPPSSKKKAPSSSGQDD